jgi:hypothetical protein
MALRDQQAMSGKQRSMVQKCNRLLIFKNTKTVVRTNHLAEGATFVERVGGNAHRQSKGTVL